MNLTRCNNGHFYDRDKYDTCPHCNKLSGDKNDQTRPLGGMGNEPGISAPFAGGDSVTMPLGQMSGERVTVPENANLKDLFADGKTFQNGDSEGPGHRKDSSALFQDDHEKTVGIFSFENQNSKSDSNYFSVNPVVGWLVCTKGASCGTSYTLKSGRNFIGRDRTMDVCLSGDKSVSRNCHAIIIFDPKSKMFMVQPGTSRELFYLNDKVVLGVEEIRPYDILTVGKTDLSFMPFCSEFFSWEDQLEKNKEQ